MVASAAIAAAIVASIAAAEAICSERIDASMTAALFHAASNQRSEKPSKLASDVPALKE